MGAYGSKRFRDDLEALRSNDPTLQSLNYEEAALGDEGARALADALQVNRTLRRLQLGQCNISGGGLGRLGKALCENRVVPCKLRRLDLVSVPRLAGWVGSAKQYRSCKHLVRCLYINFPEYQLRPPSGQSYWRHRG